MAVSVTVLASNSGKAVAQGQDIGPRIFGDARLRYEFADVDGFTENSNALTLSARLGLEVPLFTKTRVLVEGEGIASLVDDFDDGTAPPPDQPVIADPEEIELNRLQIITEFVPRTRLTVGRQGLSLDDERFLGTVAFRQNHQTYDAVRVVLDAFAGIVVDAGYFDQVNRIFGNSSDIGQFDGDSFFVNATVASPIGQITGFHYAFDLETEPGGLPDNTASSQTSGFRIDGRRQMDDVVFTWQGSFARQRDFRDNPIDYTANYWLAAVQVDTDKITAGFRAETLGSGNSGFQTPLGTLHAFQGDADVFLQTPDEGIEDYSISGAYRFGTIGPFRAVSARIRHHWFRSDINDLEYGNELDASVSMSYEGYKISLEYADFYADQFASDTRRVFLTLQKRF